MAMAIDWILPYLLAFLFFRGLASLILIAAFLNVVVLQGKTGASVGKKMLGLQLSHCPDYDSRFEAASFVVPGVTRCFIRFLLHITLDYALFGYLRVIWNPKHRSWADSILKTWIVWDDRVRLQPMDSYKHPGRFRNQI